MRSKSTLPAARTSAWPQAPPATNYGSASASSAAGCPPISSSTGTRRMPVSFFDTNVLVYLASGDPARADRAESLLTKGGAISVQVLNEVANVARRKMQMSWPETRGFLSLLRSLLSVHSVTADV